jgi:hypothetical protein
MANLPVREIVLYKHGVGFFVRQGAVEGDEIALTFRSDEINDVLKSLAVFDQSGGQIRGIHYQTPMDREARLASSSIRLSELGSQRELLMGLRGRRAALKVETAPGTLDTIAGRVIGIDNLWRNGNATNQYPPTDGFTVGIVADDGQVHYFPLSVLRQIQIEDAQAANDLHYFLDTSQTEGDRRIVNVRLSEGTHELVVYYVAPSPTWRVSYRLVAEIDSDDATKGKALLQGWGLFDNRLDEDLDDVRVTLVAGQPISFIYELYASRIPPRPTVQDEQRIAPGPIEFAGAVAGEAPDWLDDTALDAMVAPMVSESVTRYARAASIAPQAAPAPAPKMAITAMQQSAQPAAEGKATGETFQYVVTTPVTVKRGESALVPIIGSEISYQRELLYNGAKLPNHPVAALRFTNTTRLTLERGPVTVVEDGDYKGEAVIPFTKEENQVYTPYAVELGIKVTERMISHMETYGIRIEGAYLLEDYYQVNGIDYIIENNTNKAQTVTLEVMRPTDTNTALYDTRNPDVETAEVWRWRVAVKARGKAEFTYKTRYSYYRREDIRRLNYRTLSNYMKHHWIDEALHGKLKEILNVLEVIQNRKQKINELTRERGELYKQQEQLRANLGALQPTGQEAALRNRILKQLEASQDRLETVEATIKQHEAQIVEDEARIEQMIAALS